VTEGKRPWFRFHLSTCIVLMFVAGALLGGNLVLREVTFTDASGGEVTEYSDRYHGWPLPCLGYYVQTYYGSSGDPSVSNAWESDWIPSGLLVNVAVALALLTAVGFLLEWRVRRGDQSEAEDG